MANPRPLPVEIKQRRGTLRQDRTPRAVVIVGPAETEVPETLGEVGRAFWQTTLREANWIAQTDLPTLLLLCEGMDRRALILRTLEDEGWTLRTDKEYAYQHPLVGVLTTLEKLVTTWMSLLGLNSSDRGRLGLTTVRARSKLEQLQDQRAKRLQAGHRAG